MRDKILQNLANTINQGLAWCDADEVVSCMRQLADNIEEKMKEEKAERTAEDSTPA